MVRTTPVMHIVVSLNHLSIDVPAKAPAVSARPNNIPVMSGLPFSSYDEYMQRNSIGTIVPKASERVKCTRADWPSQ